MNNSVEDWLILLVLAILAIAFIGANQKKKIEPLSQEPIVYQVSGKFGNDFDTANKNNIIY